MSSAAAAAEQDDERCQEFTFLRRTQPNGQDHLASPLKDASH